MYMLERHYMKLLAIQLLTGCSPKLIHHLTSEVYCDILVWKHPNTILTHDQSAIECCSDIHCCSWCNGWTCPHFCDTKLKWGVRHHPTQVTRKKRSSDVKGWNTPTMCNRGHCASELHSLSWTWSLHTRLQLSTWNKKGMTVTLYQFNRTQQVVNSLSLRAS